MKLLKPLMLGLAAVFVLSACGGGDDSLDDRLNLADPKVRFVHAVPAGPNLTLYRDTVAQADATDAPYKFASRYFDVSGGNATWSLRAPAAPATSLTSVTFDPSRGEKYTIVALPGSSVVDSLLIVDPYTKSLASDKARVRVLNASINAQALDVYLTPAGVPIATVPATFAAVGFKAASPASGADSLDFFGGNYTLTVTTAGTKTAIFTAPVTLNNNADWLMTTIPTGGLGVLVPNDIKVLVALTDDPTRTTLELSSL